MKRFFLTILLFMLLCIISIGARAQAISLVIDNQTPGWLSSKINYGDQQSVINLKVTGYINEDDMNFLKGLEKKSLKVLDLEDVHTANVPKYKDDHVPESFFSGFNTLTKLITSKYVALKSVQFLGDSLIVKLSETNYSIGGSGSKQSQIYKTIKKYLELPEGVESIKFPAQYLIGTNMNLDTFSVVVPSTVRKLIDTFVGGGNYYFSNTDPNSITIDRHDGDVYMNVQIKFHPDTIFVPKGCKELYRNRFKHLIETNTPIIELSPPSKITLNKHSIKTFVGDNSKLSASIYPQDTYYNGVKWTSSNDEVASVSQSGEITSRKYGTTKIIACSEKDEAVADSCVVNVYEHTTGVALSSNQIELNIGESSNLTATTLPESTTDNEIVWTSSNPEKLIVTNTGKIQAVSLGTYIVTATSVDGGYVAECVVTVVQPAKSLSLNKHFITTRVGDYEEIRATISPDNTTYKDIIWSSGNVEVAEVTNKGYVMGKSPGIVYIKAVAVSNPEAKDSCEVTVLQPVTGIELNETAINFVNLGEMVQLVATVLPENASNKTIKWVSSNTSVCTVSNSGIVVAVGNGTSVVTVTTEDGGFVAVCVVNVSETNGIINLNVNSLDESVDIYNASGMRTNGIQKGVNIIKMKYGKTMKIFLDK